MLSRYFKTLFNLGRMNRDFNTREAQLTAVDVQGHGESDREQW
jgi:hypothetical protein